MHSPGAGADARAAFRYANFRYYMPARFLIRLAIEMQTVAVAWQIYELTRRPLDLGLVGLSQFLPGVLLFLPAGHMADRFSRHRILQISYSCFVLCALLLFFFAERGITSVYPIYAVLLLSGIVRALNAPAGQAFLPLLVPPEVFPNAIAWASSLFQTANVLGPLAGGAVYAWAGNAGAVFACSAVAAAAAVLLLSLIRIEPVRRPETAASLGMVLDGFRFIRGNKLVLGAVSLDMFAVLLGGAVALLPIYASSVLRVGAAGLGILRGAPGVGAVSMAILLAYRPLRSKAGATMLWCVFGFGVLTVVFGLSRSPALSLAALAGMGACDMVSVIVRHTLVQLGTPDAMRGRVSAVNTVFIQASNELGEFESGVTAQWFGTVPAVVIGGIGTILIVLLWTWMFPSLRQVDDLSRTVE